MFKKHLSVLLTIILILSVFVFPFEAEASNLQIAPSRNVVFTEDSLSDGIIGISLSNFGASKLKLMVRKGTETYTYDLTADGETVYFPLQMGSGEYQVSILENTTGTSYKFFQRKTVSVNIKDENKVFLSPMQYNDWTQNKEFTDLIDEITLEANTNDEIIKAIYDYMLDNFKYDYEKAANIGTGYNPQISLLLDKKEGICYDYSAIFSAALRYKGIPTKLVKGYTTHVNSYHAWNEVLTENGWVTVDTTVDAFYKLHNMNYSFEKGSNEYTTKYYY
jgi:transglutaminase-like putative cysteine protease